VKDNTIKSFDIRKYYKMLMRRKYIITIPFIIIVTLSVLYALHQKPMYESSITILVGKPKFNSSNLDRVAPSLHSTEQLDILRRELLGQKNLSKLINKVNLTNNNIIKNKAKAIQSVYPDLNFDEIAEKLLIEQLKKQIQVTTTRNNFITIKAKGDDRDKVYMLVKTLSEIFMNQILEGEFENIKQIIDFSAQQLEIYENKIKNSEAQLKQFEQLLADNSAEGSTISSRVELKQYNSMLNIIDGEIVQKRNELNLIDSKLNEKGSNYKFPVNKTLKNLESQYIMTGEELLKNVIQFSLRDVNVVRVNEKIGMLRRQMIGQIRDIARSELVIENDGLYQLVVLNEMTKRDLGLLKKKRSGLSNLIEKYKVKIAQQPFQEGRIAKLKREIDTNREIYNTFLRQSQGSFITEALQKREANFKFKILEPAIRPMERSNSRKKVVFIGGFLALIVSFGILSLFELLDNSFTDVDEIISYLQLPVLGTIPKITYLTKSRINVAIPFIIVIFTIIMIIFI